MALHEAAKTGFTDGTSYDARRPTYTDELVGHVIASLHSAPDETKGILYDVLELGAGTGKFTRKLLPQLRKKGARFLATEPMEQFLQTLNSQSPDVETKLCTSANIPLPDNSVQNIVCAQCFHWFSNEESLTEMRRVLVPGGRAIFVWNHKDWNKLEWLKEMADVLSEYRQNMPVAYTRQWQPVIEAFPGFQTVEHAFLPGVDNMKGNKDYIISLLMTISAMSALQGTDREVATSRFRAVLDKHFPDTDPELDIPYISELYCVQRV